MISGEIDVLAPGQVGTIVEHELQGCSVFKSGKGKPGAGVIVAIQAQILDIGHALWWTIYAFSNDLQLVAIT